MKKVFLMLFAISMLAISSCKKDAIDLTAPLVGTYVGSVNLNGTVTPSQSVTVTKLTDTRIQIAPYNTTASSTFYADLLAVDSGYVLSVPSQVASGGTIAGNTSLIPSNPNYNGAYQNSTRSLSYSIVVTPTGGSGLPENYYGLKQ